MSILVLVRHGQARAFEADSDRLTERGEEQARKVGEHLVRSGLEPDLVLAGTLVRQRRTAEIVGDAFRAVGKNWPEPTLRAEWNEYAAEGILGALLPLLAARDAGFARLVGDFQASAGGPERNRFFQRMFEVLMDHWERGAVESPGVETFSAFHARVRSTFASVVSGAGSRKVVLFTSGGPIGVCVQEMLEAPPRSALRLNWRVKNASLTEMVFSEGRVSLEYFNSVAHLPAELRTFR